MATKTSRTTIYASGLARPDAMHYALKAYNLKQMEIPLERLEGHTPAIESEAAVSEPIFLEWCAKNNYHWQIDTCVPHGTFTEPHFSILVHNNEGFEVESEGATPSEARARAIVIASAQEKP